MKRKIYQQLLGWKHDRRGEVALLIEGARRIGKSYIVEEFAQNEYDSYLLIDFSRVNPKVIEFFDLYLMTWICFSQVWNCMERRNSFLARIQRMRHLRSSSLMRFSFVHVQDLPLSTWWQTIGLTISRQARSYPSKRM